MNPMILSALCLVIILHPSVGCAQEAAAPAKAAVRAASDSAAKPASATKERPFENSLGQRFVPVVDSGNGKKILFCLWETRRGDYAAFYAKNSELSDWWKNATTGAPAYVPVGGEDSHPVVNVNWTDAVAFCAWLTKEEREKGRIGLNDVYRLPTDAEWSHAVGIGDKEEASARPKDKNEKLKEMYPWGQGYPPLTPSENYADSATRGKLTDWRVIKDYTDGHATTAPAGSGQANMWGLYDLGGNVYEWCQDWYDQEQKFRVVRGASWRDYDAASLLSSCRHDYTPDLQDIFVGFRCVLEVSSD